MIASTKLESFAIMDSSFHQKFFSIVVAALRRMGLVLLNKYMSF